MPLRELSKKTNRRMTMETQSKTPVKKEQPRPEVLSAEDIKERRETEQFNRCMKMMKVYCPNRGRYY